MALGGRMGEARTNLKKGSAAERLTDYLNYILGEFRQLTQHQQQNRQHFEYRCALLEEVCLFGVDCGQFLSTLSLLQRLRHGVGPVGLGTTYANDGINEVASPLAQTRRRFVLYKTGSRPSD